MNLEVMDILQGTPVPTFVINRQHRVTHWNKACETIIGVPADKMVGTKGQWRAFYPTARPVLADLVLDNAGEERIAHLYAGKYRPSRLIDGAFEAEDFFPNFPGGGRWLYFTAAPLHDAEGRLVGAIETLQDITERKQAEAERALTERRLAEIVQGSPVPTFVIDADHRVTHWNRACEAMMGVSAAELIGTRDQWRPFYPNPRPVMADLIVDGIAQRMAAVHYAGKYRPSVLIDGAFEAEDYFPHFPGGGRWLFFTAAPLHGPDGAIIGAVETLQDVTDRKHAEEALHLRLHLRERAVECADNGILITDLEQPHTPIVYANPAVEAITGYPLAEVIGRSPDFLFGTESDQLESEAVRAALRQRRPTRAVLRNTRRDGSSFWTELSLSPVRDEDGRATHFVTVLADITQRKDYEEQLEYQANHDALTGLPNRSLLGDRLERALAFAHGFDSGVAVLFVDLDDFKSINDTLGHDIGDRLVQGVGERLRNSVRDVDTVSRLGGDEFVLILFDTRSDSEVMFAIRRIERSLVEPFRFGDHEIKVSYSLGVALYPRDGSDANTLLKHADAAMYRAKELGRGRFQFFTPELNRRVSDRLMIERELRSALGREEMSVRYHAQVDVHSGAIVGAEALLHWDNERLGEVPPEQFLPIAEDNGLIISLGNWLLETVCTESRSWVAAGWANARLSVNLSGRLFRQADLHRRLEGLLDGAGLGSFILELQLTESMVMENPETAIVIMQELRALGCSIALDEFGTGYSSLSHLRRFPLDMLKIDRSFVKDIMLHAEGEAITTAIVSIGRALGKKVVAEGVETAEQLSFLRELGCDEYQGALHSQPMPAVAFSHLLAENERICPSGLDPGPTSAAEA